MRELKEFSRKKIEIVNMVTDDVLIVSKTLPFAPPKPKELIATLSPLKGIISLQTIIRCSVSAGIVGRFFSKLIFGGIFPFSNVRITFAIEHAPDVDSV